MINFLIYKFLARSERLAKLIRTHTLIATVGVFVIYVVCNSVLEPVILNLVIRMGITKTTWTGVIVNIIVILFDMIWYLKALAFCRKYRYFVNSTTGTELKLSSRYLSVAPERQERWMLGEFYETLIRKKKIKKLEKNKAVMNL